MELQIADIVISLAGRDQGKYAYVIAVDGDYVLLADGKVRKLEHPKRKKIKHIAKVARIESRVADKLRTGDKVLNSELRKDLTAFGREQDSQNQGG
jgi:ribosomal protein L14E/L6E/L27E